eukprot:scaffold1439_cov404-Prasinococcus_capsulatus_cf.AAC.69
MSHGPSRCSDLQLHCWHSSWRAPAVFGRLSTPKESTGMQREPLGSSAVFYSGGALLACQNRCRRPDDSGQGVGMRRKLQWAWPSWKGLEFIRAHEGR